MLVFERTELVRLYVLVCMSSRNAHLLFATLCEGQSVTREGAAVWHKWASSGKTAKDKNLSHIHTLYLWKTRQLVKRRRTRRQRRLRCQLCTSLSPSLSLSLAAAHGVSGQHFRALTRWLPGFQSLAPAEIMRGQRVGKKTLRVQTIIYMCINFPAQQL